MAAQINTREPSFQTVTAYTTGLGIHTKYLVARCIPLTFVNFMQLVLVLGVYIMLQTIIKYKPSRILYSLYCVPGGGGGSYMSSAATLIT